MMKLMKYIKGLVIVGAVLSGVMMTSCEDEPDKYEIADGLPTVNYIRMTDLEVADSLITGAYMSNTICLVGENLRSVYELYFNDQKAILNTSLITDNTLIVDIPSTIPSVVTNKIYLINKNHETVTYDFNVLVPAPEITSMSNEYAQSGTVATIYGDYFIDDPNVPLTVEIANVPVTEITSLTRNAISFVVPEGAETGYVNVESIYGTGQSTFRYMENDGILFDFDDDGDDAIAKDNGWHAATIGTLENVSSLDGNYLIFQGDLDNGSWNDSDFAFEYWPYGDEATPYLNTLVDFEDLSNLQLKFEVNVPDAWSACAMQILLTTNNEVSGDNMNNSFFQGDTFPRALWIPWQSSGSYTTTGWTTVTVPLSEFRYGASGISLSPLSSTDITGLTLFVWNGGVTGTACSPTICIDNIRVVPIY